MYSLFNHTSDLHMHLHTVFRCCFHTEHSDYISYWKLVRFRIFALHIVNFSTCVSEEFLSLINFYLIATLDQPIQWIQQITHILHITQLCSQCLVMLPIIQGNITKVRFRFKHHSRLIEKQNWHLHQKLELTTAVSMCGYNSSTLLCNDIWPFQISQIARQIYSIITNQ